MIAINITNCLTRTAYLIKRKDGVTVGEAARRAEVIIDDALKLCITETVNNFYKERRSDIYYSHYPKKFKFSVADAKFDFSMDEEFCAIFYTFRIEVPSIGNGFSNDAREELELATNTLFSGIDADERLSIETMRGIEKTINK